MASNIIGFRPSYMKDEPKKRVSRKKQSTPEIIIPEELTQLRMKLAQLAVFATTTAFARLTKGERTSIMLDYIELMKIERGYTEAVIQASVSLNY